MKYYLFCSPSFQCLCINFSIGKKQRATHAAGDYTVWKTLKEGKKRKEKRNPVLKLASSI
jgi:hypothetical protein